VASPTTGAPTRPDDGVLVRDGGIDESHLHAHDRMEAGLLGSRRETHRPIEALMVGHGEARQAELDRPLDQIISRGGAVEERELGVAVEFRVDRRHPADDRTSVLFVRIHRGVLVRSVNTPPGG
jgi:hypothetical protein